MDGTIANLYGVENWLEMLINKDETPYEKAEVLINMNNLARILNRLQSKGYEIGIVSWLAKNSNNDYDERVASAKRRWLAKHLHSVQFDFIEIVSYGTPKSFAATGRNDILFDDEAHNREEWTGVAYDVHNILEVLRALPLHPSRRAPEKIFQKPIDKQKKMMYNKDTIKQGGHKYDSRRIN